MGFFRPKTGVPLFSLLFNLVVDVFSILLCRAFLKKKELCFVGLVKRESSGWPGASFGEGGLRASSRD